MEITINIKPDASEEDILTAVRDQIPQVGDTVSSEVGVAKWTLSQLEPGTRFGDEYGETLTVLSDSLCLSDDGATTYNFSGLTMQRKILCIPSKFY